MKITNKQLKEFQNLISKSVFGNRKDMLLDDECYYAIECIWEKAQKEIQKDYENKLQILSEKIFYTPVLELEWKERIRKYMEETFN